MLISAERKIEEALKSYWLKNEWISEWKTYLWTRQIISITIPKESWIITLEDSKYSGNELYIIREDFKKDILQNIFRKQFPNDEAVYDIKESWNNYYLQFFLR